MPRDEYAAPWGNDAEHVHDPNDYAEAHVEELAPVCVHCGLAVEEERPAFEVTTWTRRRAAGGFHTLHATILTGRFAHKDCLDLMSAGHVPGQSALFDA